MLAIQLGESARGKCIPNVLPCRVNHTGPVNADSRYWAPANAEDGTIVAYFRGRKLHGKTLRVPEGYRGVVLETTDRKLPRDEAGRWQHQEGDEGEEPVEDVGIMDEKADFDEIVIWGHEVVPDDMTDPYVKGVEEWIALAEQIHSFPTDEPQKSIIAKQG